MSGPTDWCEQYRTAVRAVGVHRRLQAQAEVARSDWIRSHRGQRPPRQMDEMVAQRVAEVEWCKAVALACGEAHKGEPLDVVTGRNDVHRGKVARNWREAN